METSKVDPSQPRPQKKQIKQKPEHVAADKPNTESEQPKTPSNRPVLGFESFNKMVCKCEDRIIRIRDLKEFVEYTEKKKLKGRLESLLGANISKSICASLEKSGKSPQFEGDDFGGETGEIISEFSKLVMGDKKKEEIDLNVILPALNLDFLPKDLINIAIKNASFGEGLSLCGVFDGHMGKVAAEFVQAQFVWTLMAQPAFKTGAYEDAIKSATVLVHQHLRECPSYKPEKLDMSNSPSGCTFSIALSNATHTYFAMLGDSPIYYMRRKKSEGQASFIDDPSLNSFSEVAPIQVWEGKDRTRLIESNFPIIANEKFFILPFTTERSQLKNKRLRPGFVGVEPAGGIGDTIYDAAIFNSLLSVFDRYKKEKFMDHLALTSKTHKLNSRVKGMDLARFVFKTPSLWAMFYKLLRDYLRDQDEYKNGLDRHFFLDPMSVADTQQGEFCKMYLSLDEDRTQKIHLDPNSELVRRTPIVRTILNDEMQFYCICSDGVISNPERKKYHAAHICSITKTISTSSLRAKKVTEHFSTNPDDSFDDQSFVIASF